MRQLQYIDDINIAIDDEYVEVNFLAKDKMDIKELNNFYFIDKVFKAINSFSNKINRKAIIKLNNKFWER